MIAPQGLEIGEKLLWLFEETHDVTKPTSSQICFAVYQRDIPITFILFVCKKNAKLRVLLWT